MDHNEAIRLMAAEKYLLGELTPESCEQFEEHFFDCQECARDVRAGAAFVEHSKVLLAAPAIEPSQIVGAGRRGAWLRWLRPAFVVTALAVLLAVIGYQNLVMYSKLKGVVDAPRILASASLINANTRGAGKTVVSTLRGEPFLLFVDIPGEARFSAYVAELYGPTGKSEWSLAIPAETTKDAVPIRVPPGQHGAGMYTLVVRSVDPAGKNLSEIGRYPFELQIQN
jgi:hypothetical protein